MNTEYCTQTLCFVASVLHWQLTCYYPEVWGSPLMEVKIADLNWVEWWLHQFPVVDKKLEGTICGKCLSPVRKMKHMVVWPNCMQEWICNQNQKNWYTVDIISVSAGWNWLFVSLTGNTWNVQNCCRDQWESLLNVLKCILTAMKLASVLSMSADWLCWEFAAEVRTFPESSSSLSS